MSYDTTMKIVKLTVALKSERVTELGKKTMMLSILRLETKLFKLLKKLLVWVMWKPNIKKIKEVTKKYLNFANLAIQEFCDDTELDMNDVKTMLYACAKTVESKLGVKSKKKRKAFKNGKSKIEN